MKFVYRARTKSGAVEKGVIEASSKDAAALLLQKYALFPIFLDEQKIEEPLLKKIKLERKVSKKDLTLFFRQLAVMMESRVPVVQSLAGLASQTRKAALKKVITETAKLVEEGAPLSKAMAESPSAFSRFYVNLVKSGEASGNISGALNYISEHIEQENDISSQIKQAMIYPIFVVTVLAAVIAVVVIGVMPRIANLIKEANAHPSAFTSAMLSFYGFLQNYWWAALAIFSLLAGSLVIYFKTKGGRKNFDALSLKIPFVGNFLKKIFLARFCGNIATLLSAGISINKAMEITEDTVNNSVYKKAISQAKQDIFEGEKMSRALAKQESFFPPFVTQMIKVGEETGKMDKTLADAVVFYKKEIQRNIELFTSLLEPVMIIFLGIIVAMLAISVLSPLFSVLEQI